MKTRKGSILGTWGRAVVRTHAKSANRGRKRESRQVILTTTTLLCVCVRVYLRRPSEGLGEEMGWGLGNLGAGAGGCQGGIGLSFTFDSWVEFLGGKQIFLGVYFCQGR